jgi:hypothetical protein
MSFNFSRTSVGVVTCGSMKSNSTLFSTIPCEVRVCCGTGMTPMQPHRNTLSEQANVSFARPTEDCTCVLTKLKTERTFSYAPKKQEWESRAPG